MWHGGRNKQYIKPFRENIATTIGLFFDGVSGTLTYYKDGQCLGTAFTDIFAGDYYPAVASYKCAKVKFNFGPKFRFPPKGYKV